MNKKPLKMSYDPDYEVYKIGDLVIDENCIAALKSYNENGERWAAIIQGCMLDLITNDAIEETIGLSDPLLANNFILMVNNAAKAMRCLYQAVNVEERPSLISERDE